MGNVYTVKAKDVKGAVRAVTAECDVLCAVFEGTHTPIEGWEGEEEER